jgi:LEA14-like dessication related protein
MVKMKKISTGILLLLAFAVFLFVACTGLKEIKIGSPRNIEVKGFENNKLSLEIILPVENPNPYKVKVKDADIRIMNGDTELGKVVQMNDMAVAGKSARDYPLQVTVELTGLKGNIFSIYKIFAGKKNNIRITGKIKAGYLLYRKTVNIDFPLEY